MTPDVIHAANFVLGLAIFILMLSCLWQCVPCARWAAKAYARRNGKYPILYWLDPLSLFRDRYYTEEGVVCRREAATRFFGVLAVFVIGCLFIGLLLAINGTAA